MDLIRCKHLSFIYILILNQHWKKRKPKQTSLDVCMAFMKNAIKRAVKLIFFFFTIFFIRNFACLIIGSFKQNWENIRNFGWLIFSGKYKKFWLGWFLKWNLNLNLKTLIWNKMTLPSSKLLKLSGLEANELQKKYLPKFVLESDLSLLFVKGFKYS